MGTRPRVYPDANIAASILLPRFPNTMLRLHTAGIVAEMRPTKPGFVGGPPPDGRTSRDVVFHCGKHPRLAIRAYHGKLLPWTPVLTEFPNPLSQKTRTQTQSRGSGIGGGGGGGEDGGGGVDDDLAAAFGGAATSPGANFRGAGGGRPQLSQSSTLRKVSTVLCACDHLGKECHVGVLTATSRSFSPPCLHLLHQVPA